MSSDKTSDIRYYFFKAFKKYWPDNILPIYVGANKLTSDIISSGALPISVKVSDWRVESLAQIANIKAKNPQVTHALLFLDDFIITNYVNDQRVNSIIEYCIFNNFNYYRLRKIEESIWVRVLSLCFTIENFSIERYIKIRRTHPYYSSLQVAVWNLDYLRDSIEKSKNIWDFERQKYDCPHYCSAKTVLEYKHVVEKGLWDYGSSKLIIQHAGHFHPGNRGMRRKSFYSSVEFIKKIIIFPLFGYSISRFRRK